MLPLHALSMQCIAMHTAQLSALYMATANGVGVLWLAVLFLHRYLGFAIGCIAQCTEDCDDLMFWSRIDSARIG